MIPTVRPPNHSEYRSKGSAICNVIMDRVLIAMHAEIEALKRGDKAGARTIRLVRCALESARTATVNELVKQFDESPTLKGAAS